MTIDKKISELTAATDVLGAVVPIVQGGVTKQASVDLFLPVPVNDRILQVKAGAWTDRTPAQVTADLAAVTGDSGSGGGKGVVPAPAAGDAASGKVLKADGTFGAVTQLLGTLTTTGGATTAAITIPTGFRRLYIEFEGVSVASGGSNLRMELSSTAGVAWGTAGTIRAIAGGADLLDGWAEVGGIMSAVANAKSVQSMIAVSGSLSSIVALVPTNTAAAANAIRFSLSAGAFDAGTIRVYGQP